MKKIFLLLVLLNGVLILWSFSGSKVSESVVRQASLYDQTEVEELVLLSEVRVADKAAKVSEAETKELVGVQDTDVQDTDVQDTDVQDTDVQDTDVQDTDVQDTDVQDTDVLKVIDVYTCYVVKPLKKKEVDTLKAKLGSSAVEASVSLLLGTQEYWVTLPTTGNWESSLSKLEEIKRKGVKDLWLISEGESKGVISLGVYKTASSAQNRLRWLKQRSVDATVIGRKTKTYEVRLKIKATSGPIELLLTGFKKRTLKISC